MTVLLATSRRLPADGAFDSWCAVADAAPTLDPARRVARFEILLAAAFDGIKDEWRALAARLLETPSASLAHAPAMAPNASDLGLMLAWRRLVADFATGAERIAVVCDDPWLFRALAADGAKAVAPAPVLLIPALRLRVRGVLARLAVSLRMARAAVALRRQRSRFPSGTRVLLVYGHPASTTDGQDGYFGPLLKELPGLVRLLHVDCGLARARALAADGRTFSLHAWGCLGALLCLPFARWRPAPRHMEGSLGWLVRRAAAIEGGTGQGAAIRWQRICQRIWLKAARPAVVAWPWENHAWERDFVRAARKADVATVGYQHATVGRREWNHVPGPDGGESLPAVILCSGEAGRKRLAGFGVPEDRLAVGGAWRAPVIRPLERDPSGAVFVALPSDAIIAGQMMAVVEKSAAKGERFVVRDHPMTPFAFVEKTGVRRAHGPLGAEKGIRAVLYCATTVGLEAALGGMPAVRFVPSGRVDNDVMPDGFDVSSATAATLIDELANTKPPTAPSAAFVFAPPNLAIWDRILGGALSS